MKRFIFLLIAASSLLSCQKELSFENPVPPPIIEKPADSNPPKFQLKAFYSDIPIDFNETDDEVVLETDLWNYVKAYVKDDHHIFLDDSTIEVTQNEIKMPGLTDEVFLRPYSVGQDDLGEYMIYLTADYGSVKYRLHERTEYYFVVSLKWKDGARVFSRFERIE